MAPKVSCRTNASLCRVTLWEHGSVRRSVLWCSPLQKPFARWAPRHPAGLPEICSSAEFAGKTGLSGCCSSAGVPFLQGLSTALVDTNDIEVVPLQAREAAGTDKLTLLVNPQWQLGQVSPSQCAGQCSLEDHSLLINCITPPKAAPSGHSPIT